MATYVSPSSVSNRPFSIVHVTVNGLSAALALATNIAAAYSEVNARLNVSLDRLRTCTSSSLDLQCPYAKS